MMLVLVKFFPNLSLHYKLQLFLLNSKICCAVFTATYGKMPGANIGFGCLNDCFLLDCVE